MSKQQLLTILTCDRCGWTETAKGEGNGYSMVLVGKHGFHLCSECYEEYKSFLTGFVGSRARGLMEDGA